MPIVGDRVTINATGSKYHGISGIVIAINGVGFLQIKLDTNETIRTHYLYVIVH